VTGERATIRILRLRPNARLPERQSEHASGYDLHACLEAPLTLGSMPVRVPTGIAVAAPPGIDVQVRPRSGLFSRGVIGMPGTVDADYRGEVHVTLYCLAGVGEFTIRDGDRIAQLVIARLAATDLEEVDKLDDTERGAGGHGSTGLR
jgi:dUTP pyrophosphatase